MKKMDSHIDAKSPRRTHRQPDCLMPSAHNRRRRHNYCGFLQCRRS